MKKTLHLLLSVTLMALVSGGHYASAAAPVQRSMRGGMDDAIRYKDIGVYWKNGVLNTLPVSSDCRQTFADYIVVSGKDIYVGGAYTKTTTSEWQPCYWKNGSWVQLPVPDDAQSTHVSILVVSDSDVYVGGYYRDNDNFNRPVFWVNSELVELTEEHGMVTGLFVAEGDVYVAGYHNGEQGYWKNGDWNRLQGPANTHLFVNSIVVSDGNVFVGGAYESKEVLSNRFPCYWKNGQFVMLNTPSGARSGGTNFLTVSSGDVYAAGYYFKDRNMQCPGYWKNGAWVSLPTSENFASLSGLAVSGSDVYSCGSTIVTGYWKNQTWIGLPLGKDATGASPRSIAIANGDVYVAGGCYLKD